MSPGLFQDRTEVYEALVDWPKRLEREEPFFRHWFREAGVRSVVDVACGIGRHAALFHSWGLRVEGADISPAMIDGARRNFGQLEGLQWTVRGFEEPIPCRRPFDAALCTGNSLALAPDHTAVQTALRQMFSAVRPGGLVIVHVLNLWRLPNGPCVWQKSKPVALSVGEVLLVKGVHRCGDRGFVDLVVLDPRKGIRLHEESIHFLGLEAKTLADCAQDAGAAEIQWFGGYQNQTYDRQLSRDLIVVATKQ
ncbi:MAG: class I SAM-dependent methyltransferase [Pirellulales bacterium]|nr:class I SAM-dependent methyltransferase [Pirellulales bacterium]